MAQGLRVGLRCRSRGKSLVLATVFRCVCSMHRSYLPLTPVTRQAAGGCWPSDANSLWIISEEWMDGSRVGGVP